MEAFSKIGFLNLVKEKRRITGEERRLYEEESTCSRSKR